MRAFGVVCDEPGVERLLHLGRELIILARNGLREPDRIQGASLQETVRFSRACDAVAGRFAQTRRASARLRSAASDRSAGGPAPAITLLLAYHCRARRRSGTIMSPRPSRWSPHLPERCRSRSFACPRFPAPPRRSRPHPTMRFARMPQRTCSAARCQA